MEIEKIHIAAEMQSHNEECWQKMHEMFGDKEWIVTDHEHFKLASKTAKAVGKAPSKAAPKTASKAGAKKTAAKGETPSTRGRRKTPAKAKEEESAK